MIKQIYHGSSNIIERHLFGYGKPYNDYGLGFYSTDVLEKLPVFNDLKDPTLFTSARLDKGGHGIIWNDDIDLSCDELYENDKTIEDHQ